MPTFAEEKRSGTLEALLAAPVTDLQVVMAKYCAALVFFVLLCALTALDILVLSLCNSTLQGVDPIAVATGYGMLLLLGAFFIAFGVFTSSLTRSPVVAAMLSFAGISLFFFADTFQFPGRGLWVDRVFDYLSSIQNMLDFGRGIVDTRPLVLYLSGIGFFLFATVKTLETRQWK
jgi:ABC-2 type transport system permease protein